MNSLPGSPAVTKSSNIVDQALSSANLNLSAMSPVVQQAHTTMEQSPVSSPRPSLIRGDMSRRAPLVRDKSTESVRIANSLMQMTLQSQQSSQQESMDSESVVQTHKSHGLQEKLLSQERVQDKNLLSAEPRPKSHPMPLSTASSGQGSGENDPVRLMVYNDGGKDTPTSMVTTSPSNTPNPHELSNQSVQALVVYNEKGEPLEPIVHIPYKDKTSADARPVLKEDTTFPITCGSSKGELVWNKFICPGINAKCVHCNDQWFTPKEFVQIAGKSTLKDWKRAIRINGTMLRKMIEIGDIDYYEHSTNCSNQCRSNKNSSFETREFNHSFDASEYRETIAVPESRLERSSSEDNSLLSTKRAMLTSQSLQRVSQESGVSSLERSSSEDSGLAVSSPQLDGMLMRDSFATQEKLQELQQFWTGISQTEIFDDFVRDLINKVQMIQQRSKQSPRIMSLDDAVTMTNITNSLELFPLIIQKMSNHKHNMERRAHDISHQRRELERQLAEKRMDENDLKRKSQHLDTVLSLTPNTDKRKKKSIFRQKAIESGYPPSQSCSTSQVQRMDIPTSQMLRFGTEPWPLAHALQQAANSQMARMNVTGQLLQIPPMVPDPNFNHNLAKK